MLQRALSAHQVQLVANSGSCISSAVAEAGACMVAEGDALDGVQLLGVIIPQHQPPPVLFHLHGVSLDLHHLSTQHVHAFCGID